MVDLDVTLVEQTVLSVTLNIGPQGATGATGATGASGSTMVDTGSRASPGLITTTIAIPTDPFARKFIKGSGGPVVDPTLGSGSGTQRIVLFTCSDTDTVELNSGGNLEIRGKWIGGNGSLITLQWDGASKWTEEGRNEI